MLHSTTNLVELNHRFKSTSPSEIMRFAIDNASNPVVFTNFRPLAVAFLHLVTKASNNIPVIWVDHGSILLQPIDTSRTWWMRCS